MNHKGTTYYEKEKLTKRDDDPVIKDIAFVDDIIDGEHIADDAITAEKIAEGAVGSSEISLEDLAVEGDFYTLEIMNGRLIVRKLAAPTPPGPVTPRETTFHFNGSPDETYLIEGTLDQEKMQELGFFSGFFEWEKNPTSVEIGSGVTSIGVSTFVGCTSLTSVTIPNSVTIIGTDAFYSCTLLTSINIPDSVTSIGGAAFYDCGSLTSVTMTGKTIAAVQEMSNYSWNLSSGCIINCTDGDITIE